MSSHKYSMNLVNKLRVRWVDLRGKLCPHRIHKMLNRILANFYLRAVTINGATTAANCRKFKIHILFIPTALHQHGSFLQRLSVYSSIMHHKLLVCNLINIFYDFPSQWVLLSHFPSNRKSPIYRKCNFATMNHNVELAAGREWLLRQDIVMPITVFIVMKKSKNAAHCERI